MREVQPTRSAALALADERRLMRQGYEFLDEKRMLLATEILRQLRDYQKCGDAHMILSKDAARELAAAIERHGLDALQVYPMPHPPDVAPPLRGHFLGLSMLGAGEPANAEPDMPAAIDPSPEAKAARAAFERLAWSAADLALRTGNLERLAREYRRTERRARALEKVLLPEVEQAIKTVNEQLDTMEREEVIRTQWSIRSHEAGI